MSKEECKTANWETVGFGDGANGRSVAQIERHRKACAGVAAPDLDAYTRGHIRGLAQYCTTNRGYTTGQAGQGSNNACAGVPGSDYQTGYEFGRDVYAANRRVSELTQQLRDAHQALVDTEYEIKVIEAQLVSEGVSTQQRITLLEQSKTLAASLPNYDESINNREQALMSAINSLNQLNANNPYANNPPVSMPTISVNVPPDPVPTTQHHDHHGPSQSDHSDHSHRDNGRVDYLRYQRTAQRQIQSYYVENCPNRQHMQNRKMPQGLNEYIMKSKLAKYDCHVAQLEGKECSNNKWSTTLSCSTTIKNKHKIFGGEFICQRNARDINCRFNKSSNMAIIKRHDVPKSLMVNSPGGIAPCFRHASHRRQSPEKIDKFTECVVNRIQKNPSPEGCKLLRHKVDANPSDADLCYQHLAQYRKDENICRKIITAEQYHQCERLF